MWHKIQINNIKRWVPSRFNEQYRVIKETISTYIYVFTKCMLNEINGKLNDKKLCGKNNELMYFHFNNNCN